MNSNKFLQYILGLSFLVLILTSFVFFFHKSDVKGDFDDLDSQEEIKIDVEANSNIDSGKFNPDNFKQWTVKDTGFTIGDGVSLSTEVTTFLNIRKNPSQDSEVVAEISDHGITGQVISKTITENDGYQWVKVDWGMGQTGWSVTEFLSIDFQGEYSEYPIIVAENNDLSKDLLQKLELKLFNSKYISDELASNGYWYIQDLHINDEKFSGILVSYAVGDRDMIEISFIADKNSDTSEYNINFI